MFSRKTTRKLPRGLSQNPSHDDRERLQDIRDALRLARLSSQFAPLDASTKNTTPPQKTTLHRSVTPSVTRRPIIVEATTRSITPTGKRVVVAPTKSITETVSSATTLPLIPPSRVKVTIPPLDFSGIKRYY